jgi:predicted nucleotidyltransferase
MDFIAVIRFLADSFRREKIDFAFIGGFALQAAGVTRSTRDVDLLVLAGDGTKVRRLMEEKGYEAIHESPDVMNFVGKKPELGRVDFLLAHRKYARGMLERAKEGQGLGGLKFKFVGPEDLIGLKVQAFMNDPGRKDQDLSDIRALLKARRSAMDIELVLEYFKVFDSEVLLDQILKEDADDPQP